MATAMAPTPHRRSTTPIAPTSNDGVLPLDLIHDILLRLPAKSICRFRAVCRSWRSMLCHPDFIAGARNPGPVLAAAVTEYSYWSYQQVMILDTESGDEVKRHSRSSSLHPISLDRAVCVIGLDQRIRLLDPATGGISVLPDQAPIEGDTNWCTIGRAASTGEHKVLFMAVTTMMSGEHYVTKVLTLDNIDDGWRETGGPPLKVVTSDIGVAPVVNGVAYMFEHIESTCVVAHQMILEFDLDCEAWRPASLRGPLNLIGGCQDRRSLQEGLSLGELQDHLVVGYDDGHTALELWFLLDSEQSIWSKQYTITMPHHQNSLYCNEYFQEPLAVLDDGRIVMWMRIKNNSYTFLRIYNPTTKTFTDGARVGNCNRVTVFTWSLLHSVRGALDRVARLAVISEARQESSNKVI